MANLRPDQDQPVIMPHSYDGIQEYDQRLPNWWLFTLFGSIIFAFGYWAYQVHSGLGQDDRVALAADLAALEARQLAPQFPPRPLDGAGQMIVQRYDHDPDRDGLNG